jgi:hypothetical protein
VAEADATRVERTGIALVHEGERILPAAGSEAALADGGQAVSYHFPVEVEIVGELGDDQLRQIARYVFDQLDTTLRSRG